MPSQVEELPSPPHGDAAAATNAADAPTASSDTPAAAAPVAAAPVVVAIPQFIAAAQDARAKRF